MRKESREREALLTVINGSKEIADEAAAESGSGDTEGGMLKYDEVGLGICSQQQHRLSLASSHSST